jgi:hypothetical protein
LGKGLEELQKRLLEERSPCDNCHHWHYCVVALAACKTFERFIYSGRINKATDRVPSKEVYQRIFVVKKGVESGISID